jgi:hypothetical protein
LVYGPLIYVDLTRTLKKSLFTTYRATMRGVFPESVALYGFRNEEKEVL